MGLYLNPGNEAFAKSVNSNNYVDKTGLISYMNGQIGQEKNLIASSRPRRFGKTMAVRMLTAYYSKGCDSRELFRGLEIEKNPSFEEHLNKYGVISLDIQEMRSVYLQLKDKSENSLLDYIQSEVLGELQEEFPKYVDSSCSVIAQALAQINKYTGTQFVIIIDEWDCFFREEKHNQSLLDDYIIFLRSLFKGSQSDRFVKLAYITGILPIKKYGTQSALNNFRELTMVEPDGIAPYIGFTEAEVKALCEQKHASFAKMQRWYDGYIFDQTDNFTAGPEEEDDFAGDDESDLKEKSQNLSEAMMHVYSPNSVMEAINNRKFQNYWSQTETYEDLKMYIEMDFDGLRQKVVDMLGGGRCRIVTQSFQNDMTSFKSASDVLTLLVHLGYLAYDSKTQEAFIPNEEVRDTFELSIMDGGWEDVYRAIQNSEKLLAATLAMDEMTVAKLIQSVHMENSSSLVYNNEVSLASVIQVAYYTASREYTLIRELPAGEGFADMAFVPKRASKKPALVVELKWDKSAEGALNQIRNKKYGAALKEYKGNMLLVGINYDRKSKEHQCRIEKFICDQSV